VPGSAIVELVNHEVIAIHAHHKRINVHRYKGVKHFSAGDLLRDAVKNGNTKLEAIMKEGKLVPVEVTIGLLKDAMLASEASVFLIDGFPRALDQAEVFQKQVRSATSTAHADGIPMGSVRRTWCVQIKPCDMVLAFDCPEDVMRERLLARGATSGRADDNEETIVKRFRTFVEQSKPVIEHFKVCTACCRLRPSFDTHHVRSCPPAAGAVCPFAWLPMAHTVCATAGPMCMRWHLPCAPAECCACAFTCSALHMSVHLRHAAHAMSAQRIVPSALYPLQRPASLSDACAVA
jgi:adenylate kinase family enzyme